VAAVGQRGRRGRQPGAGQASWQQLGPNVNESRSVVSRLHFLGLQCEVMTAKEGNCLVTYFRPRRPRFKVAIPVGQSRSSWWCVQAAWLAAIRLPEGREYRLICTRECRVMGVAVLSAKNHKRQRRKRQSVTAKREKSHTPKVLTAILTLPNLT